MGWLLRALALGLALWSLAATAKAAVPDGTMPAVMQAASAGPVVVVAQVTGEIDPISAQYLTRVSQEAEAAQADLLLIELNTPGGLGSSMETMTQTMLASTVPTVVYVTPRGARAGSAGVFIAMAADIVAMAPGTVIGAAHPVTMGGGNLESTMAEKITNYASAYVRTLATTKGHNADWAEQAVRNSVAITEQEALSQNVANLIARDTADLLGQLEGRRVTTAAGERVLSGLTAATLQRRPPNPVEIVLKLISDPNIALLLILLGFIGIVVEIYHPGSFAPGIAGTISLLLAWVALGNLPTNWGAVGLLVFSLALFLLELHLPSHGILGVGAIIAFLLGGFLLFAPMTPDAPPTFEPIEVSPWLLLGAAVVLAVFFLVGLRAGLRARRLPVTTALTRLPGARGVASTALTPAGTVLVRHEPWSAVTDGETIGPGEEVEVVSRNGLKLRVRRVDAALSGQPQTAEPRPGARAEGT
jgi:membrane-bound serine protease (ClpP class)